MSEPTGSGVDPEAYGAALDRLLDGLLDDPAADSSADAQVRADTETLARALGLIGGALAAEGGGVTAAAGAVPPTAGSAAGGATVVQLSSWRSKLNPRVLAAAASLIVLLGVGIPVALSSSGGRSDDAATAMDAPDAQQERAGAPAAAVPGSAPAPLAADGFTAPGTDSAGTGAAGATNPGTVASGGAAKDSAALADQAPAQPMAGASGVAPETKAARDAGQAAFADAVACARAIFVGTITSVQPTPDGAHYKVSFLVENWIAPASGPVTATYDVYGSTANSPGVDENILAGQRRLFVVPASNEERIYAYKEKDWAATKKQIKAVRDERAGEGCS
ncbi:MAG TPA: hypothetical protein VMZ00_13300 [Sporichthya sp.]|nr:hypothetical protein [Sporichthya sp.]